MRMFPIALRTAIARSERKKLRATIGAKMTNIQAVLDA